MTRQGCAELLASSAFVHQRLVKIIIDNPQYRKHVLDRRAKLGILFDGAITVGNWHCYPACPFDSAVPSSSHLPIHLIDYPTLILANWAQRRWKNSPSHPGNNDALLAGHVLIAFLSSKEVDTPKPAPPKPP